MNNRSLRDFIAYVAWGLFEPRLTMIQSSVTALRELVLTLERRATALVANPGTCMSRPGVSRLTSAAITSTSVVILAAATTRLSFSIKNEGPAVLYLAYAADASTTLYTVDIEPGGVHVDETGWTGPVSGITSAGTTTTRVTELSQ